MRLCPETMELRRMLDAANVPYETDDYEDEDEYGTLRHLERTETNEGFALHAWSRDADGRKRFDSYGGRFSDYIEVDVGESRLMLDVDDAFKALVEGLS